MRRYLIATPILLLAGCASQGTRVDTTQFDQLKPGRSTITDAERLLGKPHSVVHRLDGGTTLGYASPAVPTTPAGYDTVVNFNQAGLFTNYSSFQRK